GDLPNDALGLVGGALDQRADLVVGLAKPREHVVRDDVGIGGIGAPHPGANAPEIAAPEALGDALQAVVAGDPAAELRAHLPEREVDLVVDDDHALERDLQRAAGGAG